MSLCQYKNVFGKPNNGLHSYRVAGFAIIDIVLTLLVAILICYMRSLNSIKSVLIYFIYLMLIAVILHRIFCVNTTLNLMLFGKV